MLLEQKLKLMLPLTTGKVDTACVKDKVVDTGTELVGFEVSIVDEKVEAFGGLFVDT